MKLFFEAMVKFALGVVLTAVLVFLPAGTLNYMQGILFMLLLFVPMFLAGIVLVVCNPALLKKRLDNKEKESDQKIVVALSGVMFILGFILAGLSFRFNFLMLPKWVTWVGAVIFVSSYINYGIVLKQNTYLFRTVKVEEGQKVIDSGFYRYVRHPMYAATVFLFLSIPLVLGSAISFVIFLSYPFVIAKRIANEEKVLEKELPGYAEYKKKVKYKLIPFIW
ncbi:MAG: isoprenylcysteine carboxylmethyltransferase family protein [Clostridia bacterium]|nr:isoprenylcysteine carboxylmethyltransferase family protein [Clostridia bacterium]